MSIPLLISDQGEFGGCLLYSMVNTRKLHSVSLSLKTVLVNDVGEECLAVVSTVASPRLADFEGCLYSLLHIGSFIDLTCLPLTTRFNCSIKITVSISLS